MLLKKFNFFLYLLLLFCLIFFSSFKPKKNTKLEEVNVNNTKNEKLLDSINPSCQDINSENKNPNKLYINIPDSKKWGKNLFQALTAKSKEMILKKYKKNFNGNITFFSGENLCNFQARIRLTGGRKTHIELLDNKIISSISINLRDGNINGFTKFKLFLPKERNFESEIITSVLLKNLGFLSPRTSLIDVNINGVENKMIMQEKISKELIEASNLRESALVAINTELLYLLRSQGNRLVDPYMSTIFPSLLNDKWALKNNTNTNISFKSMEHFSKVLNLSWSKDYDWSSIFSDDSLSGGYEKTRKNLSQFRSILIAMGAEHAIFNNNRKFYYDPFTGSFIPIYYDGDSKINNNYLLSLDGFKNLKINNEYVFNEITKEDINNLINKLRLLNINSINKSLSASKVNNIDLELIIHNLIKNLNLIKENLDHKTQRIPLKAPHFSYKDLPIKFGIAFSEDRKNFLFCNIDSEKCFKKELSKEEKIILLKDKYKINDLNYYYAGESYQNYINGIYDLKNVSLNSYNRDAINFYYLGNPEIVLDNANKILNIKIKQESDKIIFLDTEIRDWFIVINSPLNKKTYLNSRIDNNLLTSLLTIKDSQLNNIKIEINGGLHEDSLNIINSSGNIKGISIKNSFQDAIDFDFSKLLIDTVYVENAGNDCIDLSSGSYKINSFIANNCIDKGISVGESSTAFFNEININNSNMGFVAKDSSILQINKGVVKNFGLCAAAYRKKQEFLGSIIYVPSELCKDKETLIQENSYLINL